MQIAIIAPSPVPFTLGGAEKLWFGLERYINIHTQHQCEIIKLPTKERNFWDLIESYYQFYHLDLSHFDMVISGKYPAWMTPHHNHHLYMLHPLRGLYDSYCGNVDIQTDNTKIRYIIDYIDSKEATIKGAFHLIFQLKDDKSITNTLFDFPSPFIRKIIHFFDKKAMTHIKNLSAISNTVANRENYFLKSSKVEVIYPPSTIENFETKTYSYFFTASRLDAPKRIDMIIKAYKKAQTDIPLKIAGTGFQYEYLKEIIDNDNKIELLGFVSDIELKEYYANAYAVIFIPKEEDYGLITIEAMSSSKAVITCSDSGGVLEFVKHKKRGLIAQPSIQSLSDQIKYLSANRELAISMGENAKKSIENISWQNTVKQLLKIPIQLTILSTYPIYPPMGGGQNRVFYLYKELARHFNITIISLISTTLDYSKREIAPNLYEIQVPKSKQHEETESHLSSQAGILLTDIAFIDLYTQTPRFEQEVKKIEKSSDFFIITSPYTYPLLKSCINKPIIYESQNIEYLLKKQMLKTSNTNDKLLKKLFEVEKETVLNTLFTTVCSKEDEISFKKLYQQHTTLPFIPNGVDLDSVIYYGERRKQKIKDKTEYKNKKVLLFMGSEHKPNIDATEEIIKMAKIKKDMLFIVIGGVYRIFENKEIPSNIKFTGYIDDQTKDHYLSLADIALNPMLTGSGSNLKMLDYIASGIPVISTSVGTRGLNLPKGTVVECEIEKFIKYFDHIEYLVDTKRAKRFVQREYNWQTIAKKLKREILKHAKH